MSRRHRLCVVPQTACVPHTAVLPCVPPVPQTAVGYPIRHSFPRRPPGHLEIDWCPRPRGAPDLCRAPDRMCAPDACFAFTIVTVLVNELKTATGDAAVLPAGTESVLLSAPQTSRYPAPMVKMSYWLVYMIPVTGSTGRAIKRKSFGGGLHQTRFDVSGVRRGVLVQHQGSGPADHGRRHACAAQPVVIGRIALVGWVLVIGIRESVGAGAALEPRFWKPRAR